MSITFPADEPKVDTTAVANVGGAEKYGTIDGTYVSVLNVGAASITSLNADVINAGTLYAARIATGSLNAEKIESNTITTTQISTSYIYAGAIDCGQLKTGTLQVGGANQPGYIYMTRGGSTGGGDAYLRWQGNSQIWVDPSNYLALLSIGERIYFYTGAGVLYALFERGQPASFYAGGSFSGGELKITDNNLYWYDSRLADGHPRYVFKSNDGVERFSVTPDASPNTKLSMNGYDLKLSSNKTAIVPTSKGFNALYCMESPEVWFMDFCYGKKVRKWPKFWKTEWQVKPDPMFMEVVEGQIMVMKTEAKNVVQIWGKRKGHATTRFESKTQEEYDKNEAFWSQAK